MMGKAQTKQASNSATAIQDYVDRYEALEAQKVALAEDFKILGEQCKGEGFDVAAIKQLVKIRNNEAKAKERYAILATYAAAIQLDLF